MLTAPASAASVAAPAAIPSIKDIVSNILIHSLQAVKDGAEWIKGQIPDVLVQFMHWQMAYHGIWAFVCLLLVVGFVLLTWAGASDSEDGMVMCGVLGSLISLGFFMHHLFDVVEIWIAPKVYLLEYAVSLVNNNS